MNEKKKYSKIAYHTDEEELFISSAIVDLKQGLTTYVYKERILDRLKEVFKDLEIRKDEFYWAVRRRK